MFGFVQLFQIFLRCRREADSLPYILTRTFETTPSRSILQKWELFRKFPFLPFKLSTLCRQLEGGHPAALQTSPAPTAKNGVWCCGRENMPSLTPFFYSPHRSLFTFHSSLYRAPPFWWPPSRRRPGRAPRRSAWAHAPGSAPRSACGR